MKHSLNIYTFDLTPLTQNLIYKELEGIFETVITSDTFKVQLSYIIISVCFVIDTWFYHIQTCYIFLWPFANQY